MTEHQKLAEETRARPAWARTRKHTRRCEVCNLYVHADVQDCQPCEGARPVYSMLHRYEG
jgi:hypothetical protein